MANQQGRMSMYSVSSEAGPRGQQQVTTTTLLNGIHNAHLASHAYQVDAGTSLVVNTWLTASQSGVEGRVGAVVDASLAARAWEHARRRAEDGCILLGSLHRSAPPLMRPFLATVPLSMPSSLFTALDAIRPLVSCVTAYNPSTSRHGALAVTLTLSLSGSLTAATIALSQGGIDSTNGLLNIPAEPGYRGFDALYYLLTSASTPAEREFLGLKPASNYSLLAKSGTYDPPPYLPTADDAAAADDFRNALKEMGIKGASYRHFISTLAGLLKLGDTLDYGTDEDGLDDICEDVGVLLGLDPDTLARQCSTEERTRLVSGLYEALVDWVIAKANEAIAAHLSRIRDGDDSVDGHTTPTPDDERNGDTVCLTIVELAEPDLGKAFAMRGIFDDTLGINKEMKQDGVEVVPVASSVLREMHAAVDQFAPDLGLMDGASGRRRLHELDTREILLEKVGHAADEDGFLKKLLFPVPHAGISLGRVGRVDLPALMNATRVWYHLTVHPTDESPSQARPMGSTASAWSAATVSRQLRAWRLAEWANRRNRKLDYTADFDLDEFSQRFAPLGCRDGRDGIESWVLERGWSNGEVVVGNERVWMREAAWWEAESMLDLKPDGHVTSYAQTGAGHMAAGSGFFASPMADPGLNSSRDLLLPPSRSESRLKKGTMAPSIGQGTMRPMGDYGLGFKGDTHHDDVFFTGDGEFINNLEPELARNKHIETQDNSLSRRAWVALVWAMTFWIPSPLLTHVGRMKRPDVRMAWREKLALVVIIFLMNGLIVFWIVAFGRLLCPNFDKAWTRDEVSRHQGDSDYWVSHHGKVYDLSKFWKQQHSDTNIETNEANMQPFAGLDMDNYIVPPLTLSCPGLVTDESLQLTFNNTPENSIGLHVSGYWQPVTTSKLRSTFWYRDSFLPRMKQYYRGDLVTDRDEVLKQGQDNSHMWVIYDGAILDLTDYFVTVKQQQALASYRFLDSALTDIVQQNAGEDVTLLWDNHVDRVSRTNQSEYTLAKNSINCVRQTFYRGMPDFRYSARCQVNNYILLAFTIILCAVIIVKFLAALQFGSKRRPAPQDKFVICQVPAYTEGEDSLRNALDSLTALQYDNKRKLICVICDGVIVGAGNDRPTPKIVLDILGVDPKVDPPALPFKSVGTGSEQLNYGKVYSGLYEFEGSVVPYLVIVKVGKESEQTKSKPGNRGKRDSQILLMSFLNRVHHRGPMNPLELEIFHQVNNIIGVDPELYEYLLMVDADTCVREDSLNRLVAACANNAKIAGICGETGLQNEDKSWWSMIQVYEYFISHHLAKAFESLFGSVTCLPGCFSMYRLRTSDKGKPLIIADGVIRDYSICNVDTLHKKNLLSLGEDRYLTTLMTRYFPHMSFKFIADAYCQTAAPDTWSVLLSQRRRWINSTVHNLAELVMLKDMCGFCCFSMRFVVLIDLAGTIILPATCVYLGYLIYLIASGTGQFPLVSIIMLGAVYGLQALIFILKRQWQHIGWMIIYIIAFPIYSFVLPIYSFWNQDNFTWGNTRVVIGEKGDKQIVAVDDEGFDPRSVPLQRWDNYAVLNNLPGRRGNQAEKVDAPFDDSYEMDDMRSVYSSVRQASVFTGLHGYRAGSGLMPPPLSPVGGRISPYGRHNSPYDQPAGRSMATLGDMQTLQSPSPFQDYPVGHQRTASSALRSTANLSLSPGPAMNQRGSVVSLAFRGGPGFQRSQSPFGIHAAGPNDGTIVEAIQTVLATVDLDTVTKKQVRALVEQKLGSELTGERRTYMDRQIDNELANM